MIQRAVFNNKTFEIVDDYAIKSSNNEVTFNDITINFSGCSLADVPFKYQEVKIKQAENEVDILTGGDILFTGYLDDINLSEIKNKDDDIELTLTLLSPLKMATVRTVSLIGTYTRDEAIRRVLQPLIDDGFVINTINVGNGQITTNFVLETVENAMNSICSKANIFWYIDENREIFISLIDAMFGNPVAKTISENDVLKEQGLINVKPTIENVDYANVINFKNVRLIYSQYSKFDSTGQPINDESGFPFVTINKIMNKGDVIQFNNPLIVDENTLRDLIEEEKNNKEGIDNKTYYCLELWIKVNGSISNRVFSVKISENQNDTDFEEYKISDNISFNDEEGEEKEIVLQRDSFFNNLITGFKWNGEDDATIIFERSDTALRYTTVKFMYTQEIENLKGVISDSGQIERTVDYNEQWTTVNKIIEYGRSLITQNSNIINSVTLEFDKDPNLKIGDIVNIQLPSFFVEGNFAVKEIDYTYKNEIEQDWKITLKSADLVSTYIDIFRPIEQQESENTIDTVILSEFVEEKMHESHYIEIETEENNEN